MFKRVIVPLDGSPLAESIIPFLLQIAGPLDLEVLLLRVLQPIPPEVIEGSRYVVIEDVEKRAAEAREYLAPIAARLKAAGVRVSLDVRRGEPVVEILAGAHEVGADLIAMTTHGRSGLGRLLFGSVAEAVLRQAEVPVFLMRFTKEAAAVVAA
jgi:nucleotide-binding universal stress UspA family protein